ncbi:hypothetical protein J7T55_012143 [Diaporthe amygdali]|uniref:uncharacterized protein n=1 Tax=Phomopsis amygdali TaxID=1214568 RepID=UPI0022FDDE09|nr:uncharacterized protein J7T55_012143 [Diaporthe amygdali]KAJ0123675.1 hypothetical protein J7T55_012143 [Diaporthe amygdali]
MFSLTFSRRGGSIQSLCSTKRRLSSAAAAIAVPSRHILHHASENKVAGAATPVDMPASQTSPRPHSRGQSATRTRMESVRRQLRDSAKSPSFYEAVAQIMKIREQYIKERSVFVRGQDMLPILLGLGASHEDIMTLPSTSDNLESDPSIPFRTSVNSRFCFDWDTKSMRRIENQPFMLSEDEDFERFDSGKIRNFDEVKADLGLNSAFLAVLIFKAMMVNGIDVARRTNLNYDVNKWVCIAFSVRTHTTPDLLGEPALEGVHSDGADHTLVTFLGSKNMASNSAATFLHSMDEVTGISLRESSPLKIVGRNRHSAFLDTMMIVDHERKHSLTAVYAEDKTALATRDVLIFFTRRPYLKTHPAASLDSLKPHATLGVEVPLLDLS